MKQRGAMELINTELIETELVGTELIDTELVDTELVDTGQEAQTDLDAALASTLRRFIAQVSKADQGKRAAHLLWGRREGAS